MLAEIWVRMLAIYGHRWESAYGRTPDGLTGETWAAGLQGIEPRGIAQGFGACLRSADGWPPTLPEFRAMCLGIPPMALVKAQLKPGNPNPSPFVRLVWQNLDSWAFKHADTDRAERMLRDAYELAKTHLMAGGSLDGEVAGQLEQDDLPPYVPAPPEVAKRHMSEIADLLGMGDGDTIRPDTSLPRSSP